LSLLYLFFTHISSSLIHTLPLHDALPILKGRAPFKTPMANGNLPSYSLESALPIFLHLAAISSSVIKTFSISLCTFFPPIVAFRSEEHTSELQSRFDLVCRLLLDKKIKSF